MIGRVFRHPAARATVLAVCGEAVGKKIRHYEFGSLVTDREAKRMDKKAQVQWFWAEWAHCVRRLSLMKHGESPEQHTERSARVYGVKGQINNRLHVKNGLNADVLLGTVRQACSVTWCQIVRFIRVFAMSLLRSNGQQARMCRSLDPPRSLNFLRVGIKEVLMKLIFQTECQKQKVFENIADSLWST